MKRLQPIALGAAAAVVLIVLFVVLRPNGGEDDAATPTAPTATAPPATTRAATTATGTSPTTPAPSQLRIEVRQGRAVGGIKRLRVNMGERVVIGVTADVSDEVHLHGYDLSRAVAPGRPARLALRAAIAGRFEIELEDRGLQIGELEVRP